MSASFYKRAFFGVVGLLGLWIRAHYSEARLKRYQSRRLQKMIKCAYKSVPYYRNLFDRIGIAPSQIKSVEDLKKVPFLTKEMIRENYEELVSDDSRAKRPYFRSLYTSGSTGLNLKITLNDFEYIYSRTLVEFGYLKSGAHRWDKLVLIQNDPQHSNEIRLSSVGLLKIYSLDMKAGPASNVEELNRKKPELICACPSYFVLMAKHIVERGVPFYKPRVVFTHGEMLTEKTKEILESTFSCTVHDTYGSMEFFRIAYECPFGRLHVMEDSVIVEVDDSTKDADGSAEIVVTSLYHKVMPFIRYKLGDRIVLSPERCPCGSSRWVIKKIHGRSDDYLTLPSGTKVAGWAIDLVSVPGVLEYKVVQKMKDLIEVFVRTTLEFNGESENQIKRLILDCCQGETVQICIKKTQDPLRGESGKLRSIVSEVA